MKILCLDSSTTLATISLFENETLLSQRSSSVLRSHSEFINQAIYECLSEANIEVKNLDLISTGIGPGSFTGIRVALNAAKTFSYLLNIPVCGFDSLTMLNRQASNRSDYVLCLLNAYKNMAYTGLFQKNKLILPLAAVKFSDLGDYISLPSNSNITVVGDCWEMMKSDFTSKYSNATADNSQNQLPLAKTMITLIKEQQWKPKTNDWKSINPLYIRASEAEENLVK